MAYNPNDLVQPSTSRVVNGHARNRYNAVSQSLLANFGIAHVVRSRRMNFSLRTLLLAIPIIAVAISGYVFQLQWATSLSYTICIVAILLGTVAGLFARGEWQLYCGSCRLPSLRAAV